MKSALGGKVLRIRKNTLSFFIMNTNTDYFFKKITGGLPVGRRFNGYIKIRFMTLSY